MEKSLLVVDDEEYIIASLKRLFRREDMTVISAKTGEEAIELLKANKVAVIISDQLMPNMTGVEFLSKAREIQPDTIRIVLSGYSDIKSITDSINEGAIWRFIPKPWDDDMLIKIVTDAFLQYQLVEDNKKLTDKLAVTNSELKDKNVELKKIVEDKSRSLSINMQVLQISQDILEQLPHAVLGIDDDGMVVIANQKANEYLSNNGMSLVGAILEDIFPESMLQSILSKEENRFVKEIDIGKKAKFDICWAKLKPPAQAKGKIIVLIQKDV